MNKKNLKTVIVTGGTRGIGSEIVREFYQRGMFVVFGARHDNGLAKELGERTIFKKTDVRREASHEALIKTALKSTGRVDVYVNSAGFSKWSPVEKVTEKFWNSMIDTNLKGAFLGCKTAARYLKKGGCIVNISSLAGKRGSANNSVYCISKFGITALTQALAKELGPRGIRINAVCPVYVITGGLLKALNEKASPANGKNVRSYLNKFAREQSALKRLPTANEVAKACFFLSSQEASAITGQSLNIDCGVLPK